MLFLPRNERTDLSVVFKELRKIRIAQQGVVEGFERPVDLGNQQMQLLVGHVNPLMSFRDRIVLNFYCATKRA